MRLEGKTAIITGSSKGIGREIARYFAKEGAKAVINGRDPVSIKDVVNFNSGEPSVCKCKGRSYLFDQAFSV